MLAGRVAQPVLRLAQMWQEFQQTQISIERLGDILNTPPEPQFTRHMVEGDLSLDRGQRRAAG
jgi:ATP-binding cassette, subfamily B, bacterial HlyB/CyaB